MISKKNAREIKGKDIRIINIESPFSFFDFKDKEIIGECWPIRRIFSQVRQLNGKTMVIENIKESIDLEEENEDIAKVYKNFSRDNSKSMRLSFFSKTFSKEKDLKIIDRRNFLGYVILKTDEIPDTDIGVKTRVYESVLKTSRRENNYIRRKPNWTCTVGNESFKIKGYLFAQQNGITNRCAHVAVRSIVSSFLNNDELSYRKINELLGIELKENIKARGLKLEEIQRILKHVGARYTQKKYISIEDYFMEPDIDLPKYIYGSIESGFPALVGFETSEGNGHVIPIFGHTFNEDTWVPKAELMYFGFGPETIYYQSESWLSMYISHDDNAGSNFCIPRRYLQPKKLCMRKLQCDDDSFIQMVQFCPKEEKQNVIAVIGTYPDKVEVPPISAEAIGADYLFAIIFELTQGEIDNVDNVWTKRLVEYFISKQVVLRSILINSDSYARHLKSMEDWQHNKIKPELLKALIKIFRKLKDKYLWMVELSVPELFQANRRKLGEVIFNAESKNSLERDFSSYYLARIPDQFVIYGGGNIDKPNFYFIPSGIKGHVSLFTGYL